MSADTLRRAAAEIREEWGDTGPYPRGTAWHRERDFHRAVADLLDMDADSTVPDDYDEAQDIGRAYLLRIARAYLGEQP